MGQRKKIDRYNDELTAEDRKAGDAASRARLDRYDASRHRLATETYDLAVGAENEWRGSIGLERV